MSKRFFLNLFLFILIGVYIYLSSFSAIAQDTGNNATTTDQVIPCRTSGSNITSTIDILNSCDVDLPPATALQCRGSGSIGRLLPRITQFKTSGNTFFIDENLDRKNIGIFERASVINEDKQFDVEILIKYPGNLTKQNILELLVEKKIVATNGAQIIFIVKESDNGVKTTYIYDGKDVSGNLITSTILAKVYRVGNVRYHGEKIITLDGTVKILFPQPPKSVNPNGSFSDMFDDEQGALVCTCKGCPIHSFDLRKLQGAFDGDLVNSILKEASASESGN